LIDFLLKTQTASSLQKNTKIFGHHHKASVACRHQGLTMVRRPIDRPVRQPHALHACGRTVG
jgi:hypothetical protein